MGDSGLEILHGGVGGDVELGARISKHILAFAFDPLSLTLSCLYCAKHHFIHIAISYIACVVPCIIHIAISCICLVVCVCLTYT